MRYVTVISSVTVCTALALGLGACESVESVDVRTSGMYASLRAVAGDSGTRATATLRVGGATSNTYVMLGGGDTLRVSAGGDTQQMSEQNLGDIYSYTADLGTNTPGTEFVFSFEREDDESAPDSRCVLPTASPITEPTADATLSRGDDLAIAWEPGDSDEVVRVSVNGPCFLSWSQTVAGSAVDVTIPAGDLMSTTDPAESCDATVTVTRELAGTLDPAYGEGGVVTCRQEREVTIRLDP